MLKFDHYTVAVNDLDEAVSNHEARFGMAPVGDRAHNPIGNFDYQPMGYQGEVLMHLISPQGDNSPIHRLMQQRKSDVNPHGEGIYLIAYQCDDVEGHAKQVEENGGRVTRVENSPNVWIHPTAANFVFMELLPQA